MIRPLRIAEIGGAAGEGIGSHGEPGGVGQVRARLNHDADIGCAGDGEPESTGPHAKGWAAGLDLRVPEHGWTARKRRTPAGGSGQVIHDRKFVGRPRGDGRINRGSVASEVYSPKVGTPIERQVPDAGDALAYRDTGQASAVKERLVPEVGDAVGNRDTGQVASGEGLDPDAGDAVGNREADEAAARQRPRIRCW